MIQQEFCFIYVQDIVVLDGSVSVRRVGGSGSTPLLACGCTILLGLGLEVPCQTPEDCCED